MNPKPINLALVCTIGGHFEQMTNLSDLYGKYPHFWITNENKQSKSQLTNEKKYYIKMAHFKTPWKYLFQIPHTFKIFLKEKPTHVLSTGSGRTAFIPFLIAKALRIPFLHIDTFSIVNGYSKFGMFMLKTGQSILTQWEDKTHPKVTYIGPIFKKSHHLSKNRKTDHIFATIGTRREPFTRLIQAIEDLVQKGSITEKVIIQAGHTQCQSNGTEAFDFCTPDKIDQLIQNAGYVITQESAGIGTKCLKYNTKFIVMPRDYQYGELPAKSDMNEDLHIRLEEMGYTKVVHNRSELENAINHIDQLKTGFHFDNRLAIDTLTRLIEKTKGQGLGARVQGSEND